MKNNQSDIYIESNSSDWHAVFESLSKNAYIILKPFSISKSRISHEAQVSSDFFHLKQDCSCYPSSRLPV